MDYDEAKYQLRLHAGVIDAARGEWILDDGFLTSLRPYRGLQEKNLHQVMEALLIVGERIHRDSQIDRDLISTVWSMCWYARIWGLNPDGMLQRNSLITANDITRLELSIGTVEQTALSLLEGQPPHFAVYHYAQYIVAAGWWVNIEFFIPLMGRAVSDPHVGSAIEMILRALGKLGGLAKAVLPTLHEALLRTYSWNNPEFETLANVEACTKSVRASIQKAIQAIEGK